MAPGAHTARRARSRSGGIAPALRGLAEQARAIGLRDLFRLLRDGFERNDLLTYAGAISFKLFFALIPLTLFALGLLGGSGFQGVWSSSLAPKLHRVASPDVYRVVDDTVRQVLAHRQLFWVTAGALLAVWEVSGAVRAVMSVLNSVYDMDRKRSFWQRMAVSIGLAALLIVLLLLAGATMVIAPRVVSGGIAAALVAIARWPVTVALLWVTITAVVRLAPAEPRSPRRVTLGSTLVIVAWLLCSAAFAWYLTHVADYGSIFGALATVVIVLTYLYLSSIAFLTGVQLDALVQERLTQPPG
jgi:membrane protein